MVVYVNVMVYL